MGCKTLKWLCLAKTSSSGKSGRRASGCSFLVTIRLTSVSQGVSKRTLKRRLVEAYRCRSQSGQVLRRLHAACLVSVLHIISRTVLSGKPTQYCRGLYPWNDPVSSILALYFAFSSFDTCSKRTFAMSKIRSLCIHMFVSSGRCNDAMGAPVQETNRG